MILLRINKVTLRSVKEEGERLIKKLDKERKAFKYVGISMFYEMRTRRGTSTRGK